MPVPCQEDPRASVDTANDPTLMELCSVGARHRGAISPHHRGYQFLYVAIDKFTKWLEAIQVVNINKQSAVKFIKSIICRFEVPNRSQIGSSPTMGPNLLVVPSRGTVKILASKFATPLLLIQEAMDRWSVPMGKYSRALKLAPMIA
jgi:hypothetical protein